MLPPYSSNPVSLKGKTVTVFGGTGFLGRYVVDLLARTGATIQVVSRVQNRAYFLRTAGVVGQIVPVGCDYKNEAEISAAISGSQIVVYLPGRLHGKGKNGFTHVHRDVPEWVAKACALNGVERLVHISALGCDVSQSDYAQTKYAGEKAIRAVYPNATILRPSVLFGSEDNFFNMFARLSQFAPALPLIGGGHTKFQPVFVGDVAQAVVQAITLPATGSGSPLGKTYELGGPDVITFKQVLEKIFQYTGRTRLLVTLPFGLAKIKAAFLSVLPNPPLTGDQVESLRTDTIVQPGALVLKDLGVEATSMDSVLPGYLDQYKPGGRFGDKKRA